jgi:hypothetical protein
MWNVRLSLPLLAALLCAAVAQAQPPDPDLPAVDPPGQARVMTHDDATSTSQCIGKPITPLCAVETVIACLLRKRDELCRIGMGLETRPGFVFAQAVPGLHHRYRVLSVTQINIQNLPTECRFAPTSGSLPWWLTEDRRQCRPGDIEIVILKQTCWQNPARCDPVSTLNRYKYRLRRIGQTWAVLIWETPDPRIEDIAPETF